MEGANKKVIEEFRGISEAVIARVLKNDGDELTFGEVRPFAGMAELSKETTTSQETHYYDNVAAIVITSEGEDKLSLKTSALPLELLAEITGRHYDEEKDMIIEGERETRYFAFGYKTGVVGTSTEHDRYVWRYICQFSTPKESYKTKDNNATAEGQELELTSVFTQKKFDVGGKQKTIKAIVLKEGKADLSKFFDKVTLPDEVTVKQA